MAVEAGYRFIDTAQMYENEAEIGEALQEVFKEGKVKRDDMILSTKVIE